MRRTIGFKRFEVLLLSGAAVLLSAAALGGVTPGSKAAEGGKCVVADTQDMRRNHMEYLKHERIEVVREGVRDTEYSLAKCVECHAAKDDQGQPIPVNSEGQFCDSCHHYAAVSIPCFQCHSKVPEEK